MICYKDMTFCNYEKCKKFKKCFRKLDDKVKEDAEKWWGGEDVPICLFAEKPDCFKGDEDE